MVHSSWKSPVPRSRYHMRYVSLLSACTIAPLTVIASPRPISNMVPVPFHHTVPVCHWVPAGRNVPSVSVDSAAPLAAPDTTETPSPCAAS